MGIAIKEMGTCGVAHTIVALKVGSYFFRRGRRAVYGTTDASGDLLYIEIGIKNFSAQHYKQFNYKVKKTKY